jgi:succinoglycan biosynthesis protein ExoO
MRIAFVTDELPKPGTAGHLALNFAIIEWLQSLGHEVEVLLVGHRLPRPVERYGLAPVCGPHVRSFGEYVVAASPRVALRSVTRALLRRLPATLAARIRAARHGADAVLGDFTSPADAAWCARHVGRHPPDALLVDTIFRAPVLAAAGLDGVNSVLITHDLFHRRHRALRSAGYRVQPAQLSREGETALAARARHIAAIQPDEAKVLSLMCPAQDVFLLPMPATPAVPPPGTEKLRGRLVFIGSASLPNLDGLRWFFTEVWPRLHGQGLTLDLIGDCGPALRSLPEGVTRLGRVEHIAPLLHRASLAIAPLRVGSGLKIKLLDYARHGLFTVATPASLDGFAPDAASPFIEAKAPEQFARAIMKQMAAPPQPGTALGYIARHYGTGPSFAGLAKALQPQMGHASQPAV